MAYEAKILADSVSDAGVRLTTMQVTFPRMVLAEFNTHRVFSRNSASSRAIPVATMLQRIQDDPFIPAYWGAAQSGMQAERELTWLSKMEAEDAWRLALHNALESAREMSQIGVHKQLANRLLEPFMWHTVIVTATEWSNFFALRANAMAQPEIRTIAEMMQAVYDESTPTPVGWGEWHMPLITPDDLADESLTPDDLRRMSAARCARVSYLTHDGVRDPALDIKLYDRLVSGGHMSPLEHVATPHLAQMLHGHSHDAPPEYFVSFEGNFRGWTQLRKTVPNESDFSLVHKEA